LPTSTTPAQTDASNWIGPPPGRRALAGYLGLGTFSLVSAGVQPLIFGDLVAEHRLTAAGLGWAMTAEFLALAAGVAIASTALPASGLRMRAVAASCLLFIANLLSMRHNGMLVLADRATAGLAAGALLSIPTLMLARSRAAGRWAAVLLVLQGLTQLVFAAVLPPTLMGRMGANGGFLALAATAAVTLLLGLLIPNRLDQIDHANVHAAAGRPFPIRGMMSLVAVILIYAFFFGFFAYLGQIARQAGANDDTIGLILATTVGCSIIGSLLAAIVARRMRAPSAFALSAIINAAILVELARLPQPTPFFACCAVWGFLWGFLMPFQLPFTIEIDPSRRAALLVPGAQAFGASTGPLLCSFFVTEQEGRGALAASGLCLAASALIVLALTCLGGRRRSI
jgi:predicted MFS family arabinose efflux permease